MKKLFLCLSLANVIHLHANDTNNPNKKDCATPTEYVMRFLKRSGTLWTGSTDWKNSLHSKNAQQIHTAHSQTHLGDYYGAPARFFRLNETGVKSYFTIEKDQDGRIEITSEIQEQEIQTIDNEQELILLKILAKKGPQSTYESQADDCTSCYYTMQYSYNEKTKQLSLILYSTCKSKMPLRTFEALMKENS